VTTATGSGNVVLNVSPTFQGTVTTANISAGNVSASGNVSGGYILGNGALLTGITTSLVGNGYALDHLNAANLVGNVNPNLTYVANTIPANALYGNLSADIQFDVGSLPANAIYGELDADVYLAPGSIDASVHVANVGNWIPVAANTYMLGNASYPWRDLYVGGNIVANINLANTSGTLAVVRGGSGSANIISWLVEGYNSGVTGPYSTTVSGTNYNRFPPTAYHQANVTVASNVQITVPVAGYYQLNVDAIQPAGAAGSQRGLLSMEVIDALNGTYTPEIIDIYPTNNQTSTVWTGMFYLLANTKLRPYIHASSAVFYNYINFSGYLIRTN
jgi:hypothetical protein